MNLGFSFACVYVIVRWRKFNGGPIEGVPPLVPEMGIGCRVHHVQDVPCTSCFGHNCVGTVF